MSKTAQFILYNQLREDYLDMSLEHFCYVHHTGKINFLEQELKLNTASKVIDYAGGYNLVESLQKSGKNAEFICAANFFEGMLTFAQKNNISSFIIIKPVENYVFENILKLQKKLKKQNIELEMREDTQSFFISHALFEKQYSKPPVMENFYRYMRKKFEIMVDNDGNPEGGSWNYDSENRSFDKKHQATKLFSGDKNEGLQKAEAFYNFELKIFQPTKREEALLMLNYFVQNHLERFGELEDAMYQNDPYVYHSMLSTSINFGLLSPKEVVLRVANTDTALNNKEGFIRQILGWREYMYHFFQHYKDSMYLRNHFEHEADLPDFFWSQVEKSDMNCLTTTLKQVQDENFSHHIQRLMVIGNFSLLTERDPHELNRWFFEYYTDAFEWVVSPNVLAMSQFSDGGRLATKPYIASANYINKMSDYCKNCSYNYKEKYTEDACPFNYLYWAFVDRNKTAFEGRQPFVISNLKKIDVEKVQELKSKFMKKL
ncbi:hypothetical protein GW846_05740 [Candidatus Gracilibacteria bacterium]|nr:hypothetical protein [Candidatus Gracilibacteria bacterium]